MKEGENSSFAEILSRPLPLPPGHTFDEYVACVDAVLDELMKSGRYAELLPDFEELHRGEPFVMHD
jgi:hypothetical protein